MNKRILLIAVFLLTACTSFIAAQSAKASSAKEIYDKAIEKT